MFFKKKKKPEENGGSLRQDLSGQQDTGLVFMMQLLFEEPPVRPEEEVITSVIRSHLGEETDVKCEQECVTMAALHYSAQYKDKAVPPMLMMTDAFKADHSKIDPLIRSQMWDCPEHDALLAQCPCIIAANDMMAAALRGQERAEMLLHYLDALLELYPQTKAVYFTNSGKLMPVEKLKDPDIPEEQRFIMSAVNVRFFRIQGTEDMLVDSLGMSVLGIPDVQYHFHGLDPNDVVGHAYNLLLYMFQSGNVIKSGDTVDGLRDGRSVQDVPWKCQHEDALIQPPREVIDICMNAYASGTREN